MPPKKVQAKKQSELLEEETRKMESIMSMLRGQIEEEKAKVQPKGSRWAAAAEGPMGKFDSHGKLARQILSKKQPKNKGSDSSQSSTRPSARSQSERGDDTKPGSKRNISATSSSSLSSKYSRPPPPKGKKEKIEIVVEPQGGKLWGTYMADNSTQPEEGSGGALWGNRTTDSSVQPDGPPTGGSLWGPHPDEQADSKSFQEELKRIRSTSRNSTSTTATTSTTSTTTTTSSENGNINQNTDDKDLPPIGAGGALWGPPPDEQLESQKFQREVARFRGEPVPPPPEAKTENESISVGGNLVQKKNINPTGFTYFDRLVTKDILSGEPVIQQKGK